MTDPRAARAFLIGCDDESQVSYAANVEQFSSSAGVSLFP